MFCLAALANSEHQLTFTRLVLDFYKVNRKIATQPFIRFIKDNEKQDGSYWALFSYYPNPIQIDFLAVAGRQFFFQQLARPNQPGWRAGTFHKDNLVFVIFVDSKLFQISR